MCLFDGLRRWPHHPGMSLRSFTRTSLGALALSVGAASAALSGCGREQLLVDLVGGGGSGGSPSVGGGGEGGAGGSTCTPIDELCNTVDDDCDGQVDEGCSCTDGQTQPCYSGPPETVGIGPCKQGEQQCKGGAWGPCSGDTLPIAEQCDAADNDCDGQVDDGNPGGGTDCVLGLAGVCGAGLTKCNGGPFLCSQAVFPSPEVCDGLDNNCNGQTDEGNPGGGAACSTGLFGACEAGTLQCANGGFECLPIQPPTMEVCDGLDNDCNGQIDQGNPGSGVACVTGLPGACSAGTTTCSGGAVTCKATSVSIEVCDGLDNDCDGAVDDVPGLGNPCFTGDPPPCNQGTFLCQAGALQCVPVENGQAETCDGLDNDCDGAVDEGNPGGGAPCTTGIPGVCAPGTLQCQSGILGCIANASQGAELCAGASDEDCDGASATVFFTEPFADNSAGWTLDLEWQIGPATASPSTFPLSRTVLYRGGTPGPGAAC